MNALTPTIASARREVEIEAHIANEHAEAHQFRAMARTLLNHVNLSPSRFAWLPGEDKVDALDTLERWASIKDADVERIAGDEANDLVNEGVG